MEFALVLVLVGAGAAAYLKVVTLSTESRPIRFWAILALAGSLILGLDAIFNSLCGIAENRPELFYERCEGSVPYIPLYAIPLLLCAPILRHFQPGGVVLAAVGFVMAMAIVVPMQMLSV